MMQMCLGLLSIEVPGTGEQYVHAVEYKVPCVVEVYFIHLISNCLYHPLREAEYNHRSIGLLYRLYEID